MDTHQVVVERVLQPTVYRPETNVNELELKGRGTVVLLVTYNDKVLFVKPREGVHCIFPQGGINPRLDETILHAAFREGRQELDLQEACFAKKKGHHLLGECVNPIPAGRRPVEGDVKHLLFLTVPVWYSDWVRLNEENKKFIWVGSQGALMALIGKMRDDRPVKFWAIVNAIDDMAKLGLLSWDSGLGTAS